MISCGLETSYFGVEVGGVLEDVKVVRVKVAHVEENVSNLLSVGALDVSVMCGSHLTALMKSTLWRWFSGPGVETKSMKASMPVFRR